MSIPELRFRQIHLDFHTSPDIEGIGADFDPDEFAGTLEKARVDSINIFGRGHHGWIYYDTKRFPERRHPHLQCDLLRRQIEACHKRDIKAPIYITVQWDEVTANEHPEWLVLDENGKQFGTPPYQPGFYRFLCLNTPYVDFLKAFTQEVMDELPVDGLWFDIVGPRDCSCVYCRRDMLKRDMDPSDAAERWQFQLEVYYNFKRDMTNFVRQTNEDCLIFYNAGHVSPLHRPVIEAYTHLELESLPSGGWGYMHFPVTMRYARKLGVDALGMTGKFHTAWGDFHSFKNEEALQYECFMMLALNGKCCVGDQLPPRGKICPHTYDLIGSVYSAVEKKEPWCRGATPVTDIGVLTPEEFSGKGGHSGLPKAAMGVARMLQEGQHQFDILDTKSELSSYKLIILPDEIPVDDTFAGKLQAYVDNGGALIASYRSGLSPDGAAFNLPALPVELVGPAPYSPDFIVPEDAVGKGLKPTGHVMYMEGLEVKPKDGADVLANVEVPYFNRTWRHFCSHRHAPSSGKVGYPGIVRNARTIYFMHPIFTQYQHNAPRWVKKLLLNAVDLLLPQPLVRVDGPSTIMATVNAQESENRWVLHLLHYVPQRRSDTIEVLEDIIPVYDVGISLRADKRVSKVRYVPEDDNIEFLVEDDGRISFRVLKIEGHQMIEIEFA